MKQAKAFHEKFDTEFAGEYIRLSEYCGSNEPMIAVHIPCGHVRRCAEARDFFKKGCQVCSYKQNRTKRKIKAARKHIAEIEQHYDVSAMSEYEGARTPMRWRCNKCGAIFERNIEDILWRKEGHGKGIQHKCDLPYKRLLGLLKGRLAYLKKTDRDSQRRIEIASLCEIYASNGYTVLEINDDNYTVVLRHDRCGRTFNSDISRMRKGYGCLACSRAGLSRGVERVIAYLDKRGIPYRREVKFETCRRERSLPFDFIVYDGAGFPTHAIEFNGEQHYRASDMFGGKEKLLKMQESDAIKARWRDENHLPLLVIRFDADVEGELASFFSDHQILF